jgi:hypothetical protein
MDHHNDPDLLLALWAQGPAKGFHSAEADIIFAETGDQNLDQASFTGLEIAEEQVAALAVDIDDLSGAHDRLGYAFIRV